MAGATSRLALYKHDAGDLDWHTLLNGGFDDADDRLVKVSSDFADAPDPNVAVTGDFVGQMYLDETADPPRWWNCTTTGAPGTWELIGTTGIYSSVAKDGNNNLEVILEDFQARITAEEDAVPVPPRGMIDGLVLSWQAAGATLGLAAGECADFAKTRFLTYGSAWTKLLTTWVAGTGNGGLSSSLTPIQNQWYHVFATYNTTGPVLDYGIDEDIDAANLIADHGVNLYRRIGSILIAAGAIVQFTQKGDYFEWYTPTLDHSRNNAAKGAQNYFATLRVPPDVEVRAGATFRIHDSDSQLELYVAGAAAQDMGPDQAIGLGHIGDNTDTGKDHSAAYAMALTNTSQQVRYSVWGNGATIDEVRVATLGWIDPRGRDL